MLKKAKSIDRTFIFICFLIHFCSSFLNNRCNLNYNFNYHKRKTLAYNAINLNINNQNDEIEPILTLNTFMIEATRMNPDHVHTY